MGDLKKIAGCVFVYEIVNNIKCFRGNCFADLLVLAHLTCS